jgi:agmatinase
VRSERRHVKWYSAIVDLSRGVNHGTFLHIAHEEGLIHNSSIHVGIRGPVVGQSDIRNDKRCGFEIIKARDIDRIGVHGVINKIKERVAGTKVYISVDIDVLDPAFAPGKCLASDDYVSPPR